LVNTDGYSQHTAYLGRILRNSASFQECLLILSTTQNLLDYEREQALTNGYSSVLSLLADTRLLPQLAATWQAWLRKQHMSELRNTTKQQRILLVEDNPLSQKVNNLLLNEMGFSVDIAADGQTALSKLAKQSYDLVLMDINLPDMNGLEVTAIYRQQEKSKQHTPIIGLTSQTQEHNRQMSLAAGMDDYMPKPLLAEHLQQLFKNWLPQKTEMV
jgi:CheY-like chemotaxis protein